MERLKLSFREVQATAALDAKSAMKANLKLKSRSLDSKPRSLTGRPQKGVSCMEKIIQEIRERQNLRRKAMGNRKLVVFRDDGCPVVVSEDGGPGSGNFGHEGRPGKVGGSSGGEGSKSASASSSKAPKAKAYNDEISKAYKSKNYTDVGRAIRKCITDAPIGSKFTSNGNSYTKTGDDTFEYTIPSLPNKKFPANTNTVVNGADLFKSENALKFEEGKEKTSKANEEQVSASQKKTPDKETSSRKPTFSGSKKTEGVRSFSGIKWKERNEILRNAPVGAKIEGIVSNSGYPVVIEKTSGIVVKTFITGDLFKMKEDFWEINGDRSDSTLVAEIIGQTLKGTSKYYKLKK